jgi:hypothetical protein
VGEEFDEGDLDERVSLFGWMLWVPPRDIRRGDIGRDEAD